MKLKLTQLITQSGTDKMTVARQLWPKSKRTVQYIMIGKYMNEHVKSMRLEHLQVMGEIFGTDHMSDLIDFGDQLEGENG